MNDFTTTEARIRELVPRLQELSFGCEIFCCGDTEYIVDSEESKNCNSDKDERPMLLEVTAYCPEQRHNPWRNGDCTDTYLDFEKNLSDGEVKVIGHPITLEDVLEAIGVGVITAQQAHDLIIIWDGGKDFSRQSDEAKQVVHNLLFNEV